MMKRQEALLFLLSLWHLVNLVEAGLAPTYYLGSSGTVTFYYPQGIAVDPVYSKLYVADTYNNRVLRYDNFQQLTDTSDPSMAFGQPDFTTVTSNTGGLNAGGLFLPHGLCLDDGGNLWIADYYNNRVVRYPNPHLATLSSPPTADLVLGQPSFFTNVALTPPAPNSLHYPFGVAFANGSLFVVDNGNNRVVRFDNVASAGPGETAGGVYGQPNFTSAASDLCSQTQLSQPSFLTVDPLGGVLISDYNNQRAVYVSPADLTLVEGIAFSAVFGKTNWTDHTQYGTSIDQFCFPAGVAVAPDLTVFLASNSENRVVIFPPPYRTKANVACDLLGQPSFTSYVSTSELGEPWELKYDVGSNTLFVTDSVNNRLQVYVGIILPVFQLPSAEVAFIGHTPNVLISAKSANGNITKGSNDLLVSPTLLQEYNSAGLVINGIIPPTDFNVSTGFDTNGNQIVTILTYMPAPMAITYTMVQSALSLVTAGTLYHIPASSVKFEININSYTFQQPNNTLQLTLNLRVRPNATEVTRTDTQNVTTFTIVSDNADETLTFYLQLLRRCVVDNNQIASVDFQMVPPTIGETLTLIIYLPYFTNSLSYDPDFSTALVGSGASSGGGDGGGNGNLPYLAFLVFLIPVVLVLAVVGVAAFFLIRRWIRGPANTLYRVNY